VQLLGRELHLLRTAREAQALGRQEPHLVSLVAGIDYSTLAVDVVLLDEDTDDATHHRYRLDDGPGDALARVRRVRDRMPARSSWADAGVLAVALELPFSRGKMAGNDRLMMCAGAILACVHPAVDVDLLRADDWRSACGLPIRAPREVHKRNALAFAADRWPSCPEPLSDNAADAFCLAWAMRARLREKEAAAA
jgi:hypothetical protein